MSINSATILAVTLISILLYILISQPFPEDSLVWDAILNSGHIPLFGLLAICLLVLSRQYIPANKTRPYIHYLIAFILTLVVGSGSEYFQMSEPGRQSDIRDFYFDIIGGASFLLLASLSDPFLKQKYAQKKILRAGVILLALLSWLPGILPVYSVISSHLLRAHYFPAIVLPGKLPTDFFLLKNGNVSLDLLPAPHQEKQALKWITGMQTTWPFIRISYPKKDWSAFKALELELYSPSTTPIRLTLRVDDQHFNFDWQHARSKNFIIKPGENHFSLNLVQAKGNHVFDQKQIQHIWIALPEPDQAHLLYITRLNLK